MNCIKIVSVPFVLLGLPSLEVATLKAYLIRKGYDVEVFNAYLQFADSIGGDLYRLLRTSGMGEKIFVSLLFSEIGMEDVESMLLEKGFKYSEVVKTVEGFVERYIDYMGVNSQDILVFHMCTQQLLSTLYFAKRIKERFSATIWIAGYNCGGDMGESLKQTFSFIDETFSQDIEESIYECLSGRKERNETLDFLPTPDYSNFFHDLNQCSKEFRMERISLIYLQVEFSRGCWWNECSFCTLNCNTLGYRERSIENILQDYALLQKRHSTMQIVPQSFVNSPNWKEILKAVIEEFPGLKGTFHLNFKVKELGRYEDFKFLKSIGATVLVGTECFSVEYLKQMRKGQRVIDNIQTLKYAERAGVPCFHNLMYGLPFEKESYYEESKETISYIFHLPPPSDQEEFRLTYGSEIYREHERYGIKKICFREGKEASYYPKSVKATLIPFFYEFVSTNSTLSDYRVKWEELIQEWREVYYSFAYAGQQKQNSLLYMNYNEELVQICDFRYPYGQKVHLLMGMEASLYLFCDCIRSYEEIQQQYIDVNTLELMLVLNRLVDKKLMYSEDDRYLSLAI